MISEGTWWRILHWKRGETYALDALDDNTAFEAPSSDEIFEKSEMISDIVKKRGKCRTIRSAKYFHDIFYRGNRPLTVM